MLLLPVVPSGLVARSGFWFHGLTPMATACRHFVAGNSADVEAVRECELSKDVFVDVAKDVFGVEAQFLILKGDTGDLVNQTNELIWGKLELGVCFVEGTFPLWILSFDLR